MTSKRMGFRLAAAGFVLALIGCGTLADGGGSPGNVPKRPPLGLISPFGGRGVVLSRLDPLTLRPIGRRVQVGEFHDAWSFSPDRSRVALGISAPGPTTRVGIRVVDVAGMRVSRNIAHPAPQVHDLLPLHICRTCSAQLAPALEVALELAPGGLKARRHPPVDHGSDPTGG